MGTKKRSSKKSRSTKDNKQKLIPLMVMAIGIAGLSIWILVTLTGPSRSASVSKPDLNTATAVQVGKGVQEISLELSATGYTPNNITVKKDIPVKVNTRATADAGCVRGVMIPDFGINVALDVGSDFFTFIPDKIGTFEFSCQMKMSRGTLTVI